MQPSLRDKYKQEQLNGTKSLNNQADLEYLYYLETISYKF